MNGPNRIAQAYGYTACLVALIVAIISVPMLLNAAFDRANPLQAESGFGVSLISFEAYQVTSQRERASMAPGKADTTSEAAQRKRYDAVVAEHLAATRFRTTKAMFTSTVLLLLSDTRRGLHCVRDRAAILSIPFRKVLLQPIRR